MRRKLWVLTSAVITVILGGLGGFGYAEFGADSDAHADSTSNVLIHDEASAAPAVQNAAGTLGFVPQVPAFFPTSANRLVMVDANTGPNGKGMPISDLMFQSDTSVLVKGQAMRSTFDLQEVPVRLREPRGERMALTLSGVEAYRLVIDQDQDGTPVRVMYTVLFADKTLVMAFTGEQPAADAFQHMLQSLKPYTP